MKTTKEKADELVEKFYYHEFDKVETHEATIHAINAVKHTIEVLEKIQDKNSNDDIDNYHITMEILGQTDVLTELESRL